MIREGRFAAVTALSALALVAALAPTAGARLQATVDAGGLTLTDVTGSADSATLSTNKTGGLFVSIDDKANGLDPGLPAGQPEVPRLPMRAGARSCASTPAPATTASTPRA